MILSAINKITQDKNVVYMLTLVLCSTLSSMLLTPFLPNYLINQLGVDPIMVAEYFLYLYLFSVPGALLGGILVDKFNPNVVINFSIVLLLLLPMAIMFEMNAIITVIACCLNATGRGVLLVAVVYKAFDNSDENYTRKVYVSVYICANFAGMLSPLLVFFVDDSSLVIPAFIAFLISSGLLLMTLLIKRKVHESESKKSTSAVSSGTHKLFSVFILVNLITFIYALLFNNIYVTVPIYLQHITLLGREVYPILLFLNGGLVILFQFLYLRLSKVVSQETILLGGTLLLAFNYFASSFIINALSVILFAVFFTLAEALIEPVRTSLINKHSKEKYRGLSNGVNVASGGLAGIGIYFSTMIAESNSFAFLLKCWALLALVMALSAVAIMIITNQRGKISDDKNRAY